MGVGTRGPRAIEVFTRQRNTWGNGYGTIYFALKCLLPSLLSFRSPEINAYYIKDVNS